MTSVTGSEMPVLQASQPRNKPVYLPMVLRTPRSFKGGIHEDVDDLMKQFERVARFNNLTETRVLHTVYFSLEDAPVCV